MQWLVNTGALHSDLTPLQLGFKLGRQLPPMSLGPFAWVPAALGSLVGQLLGSRDCVFKFDGDVCAVNQQVVNLLQGQLDRCGPQQLSCPACGPCPIHECPPCHALTGAGVALGVAVGVTAVVTVQRLGATRAQILDGRRQVDSLVTTPLTRQRALQQ